MNEKRVNEIQNKTMKKKNAQELRNIISSSSNKNWEPEAIEAAKRELEVRKASEQLDKEKDVSDLSPDDLMHEQLLILREIKQSIDKIGLSSISSELRDQTNRLKNISTAATLFIVLTIIGILVSFCSSSSYY